MVCWYLGNKVDDLELYSACKTYLLKIFLTKDTYTFTYVVSWSEIRYVDVSLSVSFTANCRNKAVI